ncbi:MAG: hypothetical protein ACREN1_07630 [Candidatus Dormibacteria bacterium]
MDPSELLEQARYDASAGSAPRRGAGQRVAVLRAAPRELKAGGDAELAAWELAAAGAAHGTAYMMPDGWWWLGMAYPEAGGQVVLTIGPSGARQALRYGSAEDAEAGQADSYFGEFAENSAPCAAPDDFAEILAGRMPTAAPAWPRRRALAWRYRITPVPAPARPPLPWAAATAAPEPKPVASPQLGRRTICEWLRDQFRATVGPWLAEVRPQIELPKLIHLDNGGPEPATT